MTVGELRDKLMWVNPYTEVYVANLHKDNGNGSDDYYQTIDVEEHVFDEIENVKVISIRFSD